MYCKECYFFHPNTNGQCGYCGSIEFVDDSNENDSIVYADINKFRFSDLMKTYMKNSNVFLFVFVMPIIVSMYLFYKILRKPFLLPFAKYLHLRKKEIKDINLEKYHSISLKNAIGLLESLGFKQMIAYEDMSRFSPVANILYVNKENNHYASLEINKGTGSISLITFQIFSQKQFCLSVDNATGIKINHPRYVREIHYSGIDIKELYVNFNEKIKEYLDNSLHFTSKEYLPLVARLHEYSVNQAIDQRILCIKKHSDKSVPMQMCTNHPSLAAVRTCSHCGTPLCEACYKEGKFSVYCSVCIEQKECEIEKDDRTNKNDYEFAGIFVRSAAVICDLFCLFSFSGLTFFAVYWSWYLFFPNLKDNKFYILITIIIVSIIYLKYFLSMIITGKMSIGKEFFGIKIIQKNNTPIEKISLSMRCSLKIISIILIFPLFGFVLVVLDKYRQGFHDILSETYVIYNNRSAGRLFKKVNAFIINSIFGAGIIFAIMTVYQQHFMVEDKTKILLSRKWEKSTKQEKNKIIYFRTDTIGVIDNMMKLRVFNLISGEIIWEIEKVNNEWNIPEFYNRNMENEYPFLLLINNLKNAIRSYSIQDGKLIWERILNTNYEQMFLTEKFIVFFNSDTISTFSFNGDFVWKWTSDSLEIIKNVFRNRDLVIEIEKNDEKQCLYLNLNDGTVIQKINTGNFNCVYSLGNGYQILSNINKTKLISLSENRVVWQRNKSISYIKGMHEIETDSGDLKGVLYANAGSVNIKTGQTLFLYPKGTNIITVQAGHIFLRKVEYSKQYKKTVDVLVICNKITGEIEKEWVKKDYNRIYLVDKNTDYTYIGSNKYSLFPYSKKQYYVLWKIDNSTLAMKRIITGENIPFFNGIVLPGDENVFVVDKKNIGVYDFY